jgi:hypothetical protein
MQFEFLSASVPRLFFQAHDLLILKKFLLFFEQLLALNAGVLFLSPAIEVEMTVSKQLK